MPAAQQYKKAHPDVKLRIVTIPPDAGYVPTKISLANRTESGWPDVVFLANPAEAATSSIDHHAAHDSVGQNGYYVDNYSGHFRLHHNVAWNTGARGVYFNGHTGPSIANEDHNSSYGVGIGTASSALGGATDASGSYFSNIIGPKPVTATQTGNRCRSSAPT